MLLAYSRMSTRNQNNAQRTRRITKKRPTHTRRIEPTDSSPAEWKDDIKFKVPSPGLDQSVWAVASDIHDSSTAQRSLQLTSAFFRLYQKLMLSPPRASGIVAYTSDRHSVERQFR